MKQRQIKTKLGKLIYYFFFKKQFRNLYYQNEILKKDFTFCTLALLLDANSAICDLQLTRTGR